MAFADDDGLAVYVIYRYPHDFPPGKWVCRRQVAKANGIVVDREPLAVGDSLAEVRFLLPPGLVCVPRHPTDDPAIWESWI